MVASLALLPPSPPPLPLFSPTGNSLRIVRPGTSAKSRVVLYSNERQKRKSPHHLMTIKLIITGIYVAPHLRRSFERRTNCWVVKRSSENKVTPRYSNEIQRSTYITVIHVINEPHNTPQMADKNDDDDDDNQGKASTEQSRAKAIIRRRSNI